MHERVPLGLDAFIQLSGAVLTNVIDPDAPVALLLTVGEEEDVFPVAGEDRPFPRVRFG